MAQTQARLQQFYREKVVPDLMAKNAGVHRHVYGAAGAHDFTFAIDQHGVEIITWPSRPAKILQVAGFQRGVGNADKAIVV